jgi:hypothetical protein
MNPPIPTSGPNEAPSFDPLDDARLEALLRADAARDSYIEDAGFTARLMAQLPPPRPQRSYSWLGPALGGVAAACVAWFSPLLGDLAVPIKTGLSGHLVQPQSLLVLLPLVALAYGAAWLAATESR